LRTFVATLQASSGTSSALLIGDFNAYTQEDPIYNLTSSGYVDQVARFNTFGYSYVFDGAAGRLDHALSSAALSAKVSGVAHWHINADETSLADYNLEFKAPACSTCAPDPCKPTPYRSSDHDPVVVGLTLLAVASDKDACKRGGWTMLYGSGFRDQGECVEYVNANK
jgi:uncharacterized protein